MLSARYAYAHRGVSLAKTGSSAYRNSAVPTGTCTGGRGKNGKISGLAANE